MVLTLLTTVFCIYSHFRNLQAVYIATACLHLRLMVAFFQLESILDMDTAEQKSVYTVCFFMVLIMNQTMMSHLFVRQKNLLNFFNMCLINLALMQRFYGYDKFRENVVKILIPTAEIVLLGSLYIYTS